MPWILVLLLFLGLVTVCVIINLNSGEDEEFISDEDLREDFLKYYINSDDCVFVKINSLPKSFKIGNTYFDKAESEYEHVQSILSYVIVNDKVHDNGKTSIKIDIDLDDMCISFKTTPRLVYCSGYYSEMFGFHFTITNKDLMDYILNNLDKVEVLKQ